MSTKIPVAYRFKAESLTDFIRLAKKETYKVMAQGAAMELLRDHYRDVLGRLAQTRR